MNGIIDGQTFRPEDQYEAKWTAPVSLGNGEHRQNWNNVFQNEISQLFLWHPQIDRTWNITKEWCFVSDFHQRTQTKKKKNLGNILLCFNFRNIFRIIHTNRPRQISKSFFFVKIQLTRGVISENPWKLQRKKRVHWTAGDTKATTWTNHSWPKEFENKVYETANPRLL